MTFEDLSVGDWFRVDENDAKSKAPIYMKIDDENLVLIWSENCNIFGFKANYIKMNTDSPEIWSNINYVSTLSIEQSQQNHYCFDSSGFYVRAYGSDEFAYRIWSPHEPISERICIPKAFEKIVSLEKSGWVGVIDLSVCEVDKIIT